MVASNILQKQPWIRTWQIGDQNDILFRIVSRVCEKLRVNLPFNPISTVDNNSICVCMEEIVIKEEPPDGMHELLATMSEDFTLLGTPLFMKGLYLVLQQIRKGQDIGQVCCCSRVGLSTNILGKLTEKHVDWPHLCCAK
jgi:hypothetical protein